eukprot:635059-Pleurochrysis_carterae.AAC.1
MSLSPDERHASWSGGRGCGVGAACCVGGGGGSGCDASGCGSGASGCVPAASTIASPDAPATQSPRGSRAAAASSSSDP